MYSDLSAQLNIKGDACLQKRAHVQIVPGFLNNLRATISQISAVGSSNQTLANPNSFFKIWTYLQFLACVQQNTGVARDLFGDGLLWAGYNICIIKSHESVVYLHI